MQIEELDEMEELRQELNQRELPNSGCQGAVVKELLCQHKNARSPKPSHYAHGLCKECYDEFLEISGGLQGGSEPPAFQRAELQRKEKAEEIKGMASSAHKLAENNDNLDGQEQRIPFGLNTCASSKKSEEVANGYVLEGDPVYNKSPELENVAGSEDEAGFSDIDDIEVEGYLHTEEERHYKKIIWEEMNKEYLQEQAAKEAAAAVAREELIAMYGDDEEALRAAQELAATSAAAVAKSRKEKRQKRAEEAKKMGPPKNAAEATSQMLKRKTFSSKINYDALKALYTSCGQEDAKKQCTESGADDISDSQHGVKRSDKIELEDAKGGDYSEDYNEVGEDSIDYNGDAVTDGFDDDYYAEDDYAGGEYFGEYDESYD